MISNTDAKDANKWITGELFRLFNEENQEFDDKKINPNDTFKVIKINSKNIKVQGDGGSYTVAPSLLVKKTFTTEVYS